MSILTTLTTAALDCNLHFCLYGGYGAHLLHCACVAFRAGKTDTARELAGHGFICLGLGLV